MYVEFHLTKRHFYIISNVSSGAPEKNVNDVWGYDLVTFWKLPNLTDRDLPHLDLPTSEKLANQGRINPRHCKDFYRDIFDYVSSLENQELEEYNEETGKHDLYVNSSEFELNYKGSQIYITVKSLDWDKNPFYNIKVGFRCQCGWLNIKNEAALNG